jgi:hypothetical protein
MTNRPNSNANTNTLTVRLELDMIQSLKALPEPVTSSAVIRVLVRKFLAGAYPELASEILEESVRSQHAERMGAIKGIKAIQKYNQNRKKAS